MANVTDIPDWTCVEVGRKFDFHSVDPATLKDMFDKSPISHVDKVKAPIFLAIGKVDLRVPPSQGLAYYHNLKARGKKVKMNVYDDNHPLGKVMWYQSDPLTKLLRFVFQVSSTTDVFINAALFFKDCLEY